MVVVFVVADFFIMYCMLFKKSGIALICRVLHGLFKLASELFGINIQVSNSCLHEGAQAHWSLYRNENVWHYSAWYFKIITSH